MYYPHIEPCQVMLTRLVVSGDTIVAVQGPTLLDANNFALCERVAMGESMVPDVGCKVTRVHLNLPLHMRQDIGDLYVTETPHAIHKVVRNVKAAQQ